MPSSSRVGMISDSGFFHQSEYCAERGDGLDGVRPPNRLGAGLGQAEMPHLALRDQLFHRPGHILDRHFRIDPVLVEQVDGVDPETFERGVGNLADVLGPAVQSGLPAALADLKSEFRGNHHLGAERRESLAHELLVDVRAVDFRGVEKSTAARNGCPDHRDHLLLVAGRAVAGAHAHAAESDGRHFEAAVAEFPPFHLRYASNQAMTRSIRSTIFSRRRGPWPSPEKM